MIFTIRLLLFCPFLLHLVLPESSVQKSKLIRYHIHSAYEGTYKFTARSSAFLITLQTVLVIKDNYQAGLDSAVSRILQALNDSPAVSTLGYDYILSVISLLTWYCGVV